MESYSRNRPEYSTPISAWRGEPGSKKRERRNPIGAPITFEYGGRLEGESYPKPDGPASLIPVWLTVPAVNRNRPANAGWILFSRTIHTGRRQVQQGRNIVRMKCGDVEGYASSQSVSSTPWRDEVRVEATGDIFL